VAVTDLEALRQAIDAPALNLYGVSYGSRVAQHYLRRFPEKTRSVILDGVAPPQLALGPGIAIEAQKALDAIFSRCSESERCQARFPDLQREFAELDATLRAAPLTLDVADPLTGVLESVTFGELELAGAIRLLSYDPNTVALLPLLVHEAAQGNLHPLVAQFQMISASMEDALSLGMHNAIVCSEDYPHFATSEYSREDAEVSYIGPLMLDALEAMCSVWPIGPVDIGFHAPVRSATPVLLLSGEADPVTPPRFAEMAAVDLSNARHITGRRQGHGQAIRGCMPEVIGRFVQSASVDDLQEDCFERVFAMPFFLDFTGPAP
jgi:pimeloyl-ACP methyl ester carboxylesterase